MSSYNIGQEIEIYRATCKMRSLFGIGYVFGP